MQNVISDHKARRGLEGSGVVGPVGGGKKSLPLRRLATAARTLGARAVLGAGRTIV